MGDFLSLFVATVALVTAIWSAAVTRKHNRLSVKPLLAISESIADKEGSKGMYLINCGFGPAIIRSFEVFFEDEKILADSVENLNLEIKKHLNQPKSYFRYSLFNDGDPIQTGEKNELFALGPNDFYSDLEQEEKAKFVRGVRNLNWKIEYESIYEETFEVAGGGGET